MKKIIFLCGAKDFHAMDKVHLTVEALGKENITLITDTLEGEGQKSRIMSGYEVKKLYIIDRFIPRDQNNITSIWRNIIKLIVLPIQVLRLRSICRNNQTAIIHAIPMYYMLLCYFARVRYIATPQGSEILVRVARSRLYKYFAKKAIIGADKVIVDSATMKSAIKSLCGVESLLIKNGFNTSLALSVQDEKRIRTRVLSIRGFFEMYRINEIIVARNNSKLMPEIDFVYPSRNTIYERKIIRKLIAGDKIHGLIKKENLYSLMGESILVISIPASDSSPRSVYESIFCGAIVAMTFSRYYLELPQCMRQRIFLVNLDSETWFDEALEYAKAAVKYPYKPSMQALEFCDQNKLINEVITHAYEL